LATELKKSVIHTAQAESSTVGIKKHSSLFEHIQSLHLHFQNTSAFFVEHMYRTSEYLTDPLLCKHM